MANIHAFHAIRPGEKMFYKHESPMETILEFNAGDLQFKLGLEHNWQLPDDNRRDAHDEYLEDLLGSGEYIQDENAAIYIYETSIFCGSQIGVWALTDLNDFGNGKIITHENTLSENEDGIRNYRENVGIEGSPILLSYYCDGSIASLIQFIRTTCQPECFSYKGQINKIWKVDSPLLISSFTEAFRELDKVYLADGHHRLAAAWQLNRRSKQLISSLYVPLNQLKIREFNRVVVDGETISGNGFLELIDRYFYKSAIPYNKPYRPDKIHRFGLCYQGLWYQLDLRADQYLTDKLDVNILQDYILHSAFDIQDPRADKRLISFGPEEDWKVLLDYLNDEKSAIAFTLYPIEMDVFVAHADKMIILPPKSTWIEPKIPFGLIMYCSTQPVVS